MIKLNITELATIIDATLLNSQALMIEAISTDSRQDCANTLFFALKGTNFDGANFAVTAVDKGAIALVLTQELSDLSVPQLIVDDVNQALAKLATWLLQHLKQTTNLKVLAVTGSSGKTSVKEMTAAIMQEVGRTLATKGNLNNELGVPLTLLALKEEHKFLVIELGANHPHEIEYTTHLAKPDIALINNIGSAHLAGFKDLAGVANAKAEIYLGLDDNGVAIYNYDQEYLPIFKQYISAKHKINTFSLENKVADFYAKAIKLKQDGTEFILVTPIGEVLISLPNLGLHNVTNAVAAASLAYNAGANLQQIQQGLAKVPTIKGRLCPIKVNAQLTLLDDTYNANLSSMLSAVDTLQQFNAQHIFVVADMKELGAHSKQLHHELAEYVATKHLDLVVSYGQDSEIISQLSAGKHFTEQQDLINYLIDYLQDNLTQETVLLGKGSNSMGMNKVISAIKDFFQC